MLLRFVDASIINDVPMNMEFRSPKIQSYKEEKEEEKDAKEVCHCYPGFCHRHSDPAGESIFCFCLGGPGLLLRCLHSWALLGCPNSWGEAPSERWKDGPSFAEHSIYFGLRNRPL